MSIVLSRTLSICQLHGGRETTEKERCTFLAKFCNAGLTAFLTRKLMREISRSMKPRWLFSTPKGLTRHPNPLLPPFSGRLRYAIRHLSETTSDFPTLSIEQYSMTCARSDDTSTDLYRRIVQYASLHAYSCNIYLVSIVVYFDRLDMYNIDAMFAAVPERENE